MTERYKTAITLGFFLLAAILLVVVAFIIHVRPDATATMISFGGGVLTTATSTAVTIYLLSKQNQKLDRQDDKLVKVEQQTNGNLSRAVTEIERLNQLLAERNTP